MSSHKYAPWRRSVLIPFWIVQILFELIIVAALGLSLGAVGYFDNNGWDFTNKTAFNIVAGVGIALGLICLILTITEIILLARRKLKPKTFVIFNAIKSIIWTGLFIWDIVVVVKNDRRRYVALGLVVEAILLLAFITPLIYSSVIYHRACKSAHNALYNDFDMPINTSYPSQTYDAPVGQYSGRYEAPHRMGNHGGSGVGGYEHTKRTHFEDYRIGSGESVPLKGMVGDRDDYVYEMGSRREVR
ncbi:hypothetical protein B0O99DRAFT_607738 [Bisporella sp. PMI_857]|nr:hypothetical protein B0O99DRAFT_607738 [Bisporella sp. PMI_857]